MIKQRLHIQTPDRPAAIITGISEMVGQIAVQEIDVAIAYATRRGCDLLSERLGALLSNWRSIKKRWLVSINGRVTEPNALRFLKGLPNSEVRVPDVLPLLNNGCRGSKLFHCKLFFFEAKRFGHIAVFSGSANMTATGLLSNVEQGHSLILKPGLTVSELLLRNSIRAKKSVVRTLFDNSEVLTDDLIDEYALLPRPRFQPDNIRRFRRLTSSGTETTFARDLTLATATNLWVEIRTEISNKQIGNSGNQMDGPKGMRVFFNEMPAPVAKNQIFGSVRLHLGAETYDGTLKYGDNGMDKLNLPPCNNPGPQTYVGRTVLFTRLHDGTFEMTVGTRGDASTWKKRSSMQGTFFRMRSGREWGAFS